MQDRTPQPGNPENPPAGGAPSHEEITEAENLLAAGFDHLEGVSLAEEYRTYFDAGWDSVMDDPNMSSFESARHLPHRVAAGIRWLLAHPLDSIPNDDALSLTQGIAYYQGVEGAVTSFMKVPRVQRLVAELTAPAVAVPPQRPPSGESGS